MILSEFPELCGVEQNLSDRCVDVATAERFSRLMRTYNDRAKAVGSGFDMNPSPGNIRDGLITDAIKSAGAAKKGGTSPVAAVLDYPEKVTKPGLNLLCTPGNDVESTTAEVAAGANIVLFTTGLGTPDRKPGNAGGEDHVEYGVIRADAGYHRYQHGDSDRRKGDDRSGRRENIGLCDRRSQRRDRDRSSKACAG